MARRRIVVLGAGGCARETRWIIEAMNDVAPQFEFLGYVVSDLARLADYDSRSEVLGDYDWLYGNRAKFDALALGIGTPTARLKVAGELLGDFPTEVWPTLMHPTATFDRRSCKFGAGAIVCAGAIATVGVEVGDFSLVNLTCTLGHEAVIGRGSVLNPTVNISGGVVLEEGVLVGTGAQILQYLRVGAGAIVGAGAVVTKPVPAGQRVVGIPARILNLNPKPEGG